MQHNVAQFVGCYDPLLGFGKISVEPHEKTAQKIARKSLSGGKVIIHADLHVHGLHQFEGITGTVPADKLLDFLIDIKPAH